MTPDEHLLQFLQEDLDICRDYLKQISLAAVKSQISKYPIFVAWRGENDLDLGLPLINRNELDLSFSFNVSHLEDFVLKGVIIQEKAGDFIKTYKNPAEYLCIFLAEEGAMSFVYAPFEKNQHDGREHLN